MIGGIRKSKQTGHSRRLARLLLKSDLGFRRAEPFSLAAILCTQPADVQNDKKNERRRKLSNN
jgi:hypothetical protein